MSTPVAITLAVVFAVSLAALTAVVVALVRRVKTLATTMTEIRETLEPELADLQRETTAAQEELARISDRAASPGDRARLH